MPRTTQKNPYPNVPPLAKCQTHSVLTLLACASASSGTNDGKGVATESSPTNHVDNLTTNNNNASTNDISLKADDGIHHKDAIADNLNTHDDIHDNNISAVAVLTHDNKDGKDDNNDTMILVASIIPVTGVPLPNNCICQSYSGDAQG